MRKIYIGLFILTSCMFLSMGVLEKKIDYSKARNKNVCKVLKEDVLIYVVFVSNKVNRPFTELDILSTMDSINVAVQWINNRASENKINLKISTAFHIGDNFATVKKELPAGSVLESATQPNLSTGIKNLNEWADYIAKRVGATFLIEETPGIQTPKNPRDKESLIAFLRDKYKVESVALFYVVNNYFVDDLSISMNTMSNSDVEFSLISYKWPSVFAHNFLHLFGAADMHETPFRQDKSNIELAKKLYPDDIMQSPEGENIREMKLGEMTKYLIGWSETADSKFAPLLTDKKER